MAKHIKCIIVGVLFLFWQHVSAAALFNVVSSGATANASINLCLNGKGPLSCQAYRVSGLNLSITTKPPNKVYPSAGIRINTAGYALANEGQDCIQGPNGYCYFSVSNATAASIVLTKSPRYIVVPSSDGNGLISPSTPQSVSKGGSLTFTATPSDGYVVYQWLLDGVVVQTSGSTYTLNNIQTNHTVQVSFTTNTTQFYAGGGDGNVYVSANGGVNWSALATPPGGANNGGVNSVIVTPRRIFAATESGFVYFSTDAGATWTEAGGGSPDGTAVNALFYDFNNCTLYVGTQGTPGTPGKLFASVFYNDNWTAVGTPAWTGPVYSVGVNDPGLIVVGTETRMYAYLSNTWQASYPSADGSAITGIYFRGFYLYFGSANENLYYYYLPPGLSPPTPTYFAQTVYSFFVNSDRSQIVAGTQAGYVFSLTTGDELGFVASTPINSLFIFN